MKKNSFSIFALTGLIALFFRNFLIGQDISWGDAPFYFGAEFVSNIADFYGWTYEGASFGGPNLLLWLEPWVSVVSIYASFIGWESNLALSAFFYLPAIFLAATSSFVFARFLGIKKAYLVSLLYSFNTYFLLLLDGGQLGVALAYGIFPLALLGLFNLQLKKPASVILALLLVQALTFADPRFSAISLLAAFIYLVLTRASALIAFVPLGIFMFLFNGFWLLPILSIGFNGLSLEVSGLQLYSLLNGFSLYQPSWPQNQYGVVTYPSLIFWLLAGLVWLFFITKSKFKTSPLPLMLLLFIFLLKGTTPPLGDFYAFLINLPFGSAIRDSSKFFAPVVLFSGVLLASFWDRVKANYWEIIVWVVVFLSVAPALTSMNFVLSGRPYPDELMKIGKMQEDSKGFNRTVWFPQVHPTSYESSRHQALNAYELANIDIFAINIKGSRDLMNFMSEPDSINMLQELGINRLVLAGDHRKINHTDEELYEWKLLEDKVNGTEEITMLTDKFYKLDSKPPLFKTDTLHILSDYPLDGFEGLSDTTVSFLSDGMFDANILSIAPEGSVVIKANETDIAMNLLMNKINPLPKGDWASYKSSERLTWQYQLAIRNMPLKAFDYGKGISFSENEGEAINVRKTGEVLALRIAFRDDLSKLIIKDGEITYETTTDETAKFNWYFWDINSNNAVLINGGGLVALNAYAWLDRDELNDAIAQAQGYLTKFNDPKEDRFYAVDYQQISPVEYRLAEANGNWLMFSDKFHPLWKIENEPHFVTLGGFNGYLLDQKDAQLIFEGQKYVSYGFILTLFGYSSFIVAIIYLWRKR